MPEKELILSMQKKVLIVRIGIETISFLFILLFMYAALVKLMDYQKFAIQLGQSPMLTRWANIIAWIIPALEIAVSILLMFARTQKIALYAALNLMVMFTAYIVIILNFSPQIPCSCGGVLERLGWTDHLVFNSFFIVLGIAAILLYDLSKAADHATSFSNKGLL
jgi:hypothetical protein